MDERIESALLALLLGEEHQSPGTSCEMSKAKRKVKKGDPRIIVSMSDVETAVFGNVDDPERIYGRNKNRAKRGLPDAEEWRSVDMEDEVQQLQSRPVEVSYDVSIIDSALTESDVVSIQNHVRPSQLNSDVNGSIGGEKGWSERIEETPEMLQKRLKGQKKAQNRELVRSAARRAVTFGLLVDGIYEQPTQNRTHCERPEKVRRKCEALMNGRVVDPSFAKGDWSIRWRED